LLAAVNVGRRTHNQDTVAGKGKWFTTTHWSIVLSAGQTGSPEAEAALEKLCRTYWYPLYGYVRRGGHPPHDAQDLVQGFFQQLLAKNYLSRADQQKGRFRSFLLSAFNFYLGNERDRANAAKRGGGREVLSLDQQLAEGLLSQEPVSDLSPEREFERRWASAVLQQALTRVRQGYESGGNRTVFEGLKQFLEGDPRPGQYAEIGRSLGMSTSTVSVSVHRLRQAYRASLRAEIADTVTSPDEIEDEMRHLFAVLAG
jgi:RNA polymerase sigma-70 factor (ECF subfamily)